MYGQWPTERVKNAVLAHNDVTGVSSVQRISEGLNTVVRGTLTTTHSGTSPVIIKVGTWRENKPGALRAEPFVLSLLRDETPATVPQPIVAGEYAETVWFAMEQLEGEVQPADECSISFFEILGTVLAQTHTFSFRRDKSFGAVSSDELYDKGASRADAELCVSGQESTWPVAYLDAVNAIISDAFHQFASEADQLLEFVNTQSSRLPATPAVTLAHRDYWNENVLYDAGDVAIIDWTSAAIAPPLFSRTIAECFAIIFPDIQHTVEKLEAFRRGYESVRSLEYERDERLAYEAYALARAFRGFPYWYRHDSPSQRDKAIQQYQRLTETLLQRDEFESTLYDDGLG